MLQRSLSITEHLFLFLCIRLGTIWVIKRHSKENIQHCEEHLGGKYHTYSFVGLGIIIRDAMFCTLVIFNFQELASDFFKFGGSDHISKIEIATTLTEKLLCQAHCFNL